MDDKRNELPPADLTKGSSRTDWQVAFDQSMIPISMIISEMSKVDLLFTIGRLLLLPAFLITAIIVIISAPIIGAWARYHRSKTIEPPSILKTNQENQEINQVKYKMVVKNQSSATIENNISLDKDQEGEPVSRRRLK